MGKPRGREDAQVPSLVVKGPSQPLARELARGAPLLPGSASLHDVRERLRTSDSGAVLVRSLDGATTGVVLLQHLRELSGDSQPRSALQAADLMRPTLPVAPDTLLTGLVAACVGTAVEALHLDDPDGRAPPLVITRTVLGQALVDWYSRHTPPR